MTSILRISRKKGSVGLILVGATAAISLLLMFNAIFLPSNRNTPIGARAATLTTLYPVADTMLKKDSPNHNYGSSASLSCQGNDERVAYFKFDLSSLSNNRIISAKLQLQLLSDGGSDADQYIEYVKSSDWQENSVTYNTVYSGTNNDLKPSQVIATLNGGNASELLQIPVTQIVTQQAGSFLTLACVPKELADGDDLKFNSREATSGRPALVIESEPLPTPTATPTGSSGGFGGITLGQTVSGIIYVTLYTDQNSTNYVKFYIDNTFINEEHSYPYSLGGDTNGVVNGYDTRQLTNGQHILKAEIFYKDGASEIYQVNFNVVNNPTATPTCIPLPSCAWPGANPACTISAPPNGGSYCAAPSITPTPTCIPRPACALPGANPQCIIDPPPGGWICPISPTPTCIPLPSCAWPGANPVCSIAAPPNGGSYCAAPTLTPTPTCAPRPACLDAEPRCLMSEPMGGWCPVSPTPTPTYICPMPTLPYCPNGTAIPGPLTSNGCRTYICTTPTPTSCAGLVPPSSLIPEGAVPAGETNFTWSGQSAAVKYALRIDDLSDDFNFTYVNGKCVAANSGDICIDDLSVSNYPFTLKAGHTYRWWVHAINSCNNWSSAASVQINVQQPAPSTNPTGSVNRINWNTPWVKLEADGFYIFVNNKYYYGSAASLQLHSDPADSGDPDYTTLEASWNENNYPMKVNFYFRKDMNNWWTEKIAISDGNTPANWIFLEDFGPYMKNTLHTPFNFSGDFHLSKPGAILYFKNLSVLPFLPQIITMPPTISVPPCALKPRGDADCDGKIDMIDFEIWRQEFIGSATTKDADFDSSIKVDLVDFEAWRQGFVASF